MWLSKGPDWIGLGTPEPISVFATRKEREEYGPGKN